MLQFRISYLWVCFVSLHIFHWKKGRNKAFQNFLFFFFTSEKSFLILFKKMKKLFFQISPYRQCKRIISLDSYNNNDPYINELKKMRFVGWKKRKEKFYLNAINHLNCVSRMSFFLHMWDSGIKFILIDETLLKWRIYEKTYKFQFFFNNFKFSFSFCLH